MPRVGYGSVAEYIAAQPAAARSVLERVRATKRKALPGAVDDISYSPERPITGTARHWNERVMLSPTTVPSRLHRSPPSCSSPKRTVASEKFSMKQENLSASPA